jgi:hypothetical protein
MNLIISLQNNPELWNQDSLNELSFLKKERKRLGKLLYKEKCEALKLKKLKYDKARITGTLQGSSSK